MSLTRQSETCARKIQNNSNFYVFPSLCINFNRLMCSFGNDSVMPWHYYKNRKQTNYISRWCWWNIKIFTLEQKSFTHHNFLCEHDRNQTPQHTKTLRNDGYNVTGLKAHGSNAKWAPLYVTKISGWVICIWKRCFKCWMIEIKTDWMKKEREKEVHKWLVDVDGKKERKNTSENSCYVVSSSNHSVD